MNYNFYNQLNDNLLNIYFFLIKWIKNIIDLYLAIIILKKNKPNMLY